MYEAKISQDLPNTASVLITPMVKDTANDLQRMASLLIA